MIGWKARFASLATIRIVGALLLLTVFAFQSLSYASGPADLLTQEQHHEQDHALGDHPIECPMAAQDMIASALVDQCPDHFASGHCSVTQWCLQITGSLTKIDFHGVLTAQSLRFEDERALKSRPSSPQDRPPRLV